MDERNEIATMLELMLQPAFRVENETITHVNQAAAGFYLQPGQQVLPLIASGQEEYQTMGSGCLYLELSLHGQKIGASILRMPEYDIFTLEQQASLPQLNAMALAAVELRRPLIGAMAIAEQMLPKLGQQEDVQAAQMNRRLHQLLRVVNNMTDAAGYASAQTISMEYVGICSFLEEILQKTADLAQKANLQLEYSLPNTEIYTLVNTEKLERAVYNLLSNALKFAPSGSVIQVKLVCRNERLYFTVVNDHEQTVPLSNIYNRFLRDPGYEDPRNGIGLGMVLVRTTATLHGGAVLVEQAENSIRITMTLKVSHPKDTVLRSPSLSIDYSGERDHCLIELSDVLPASVYDPNN